MRLIRLSAMLVSTLIVLAAVGTGAAVQRDGAAKTTWDGVYSAAQSARGGATSMTKCAVCHGETLEGTDMAPMIQGSDYRASWNGRSLADLFDKVKVTMPGNDPGSLSPADTADLIAYILEINKYPAGTADLPSDPTALRQIRMTPAR